MNEILGKPRKHSKKSTFAYVAKARIALVSALLASAGAFFDATGDLGGIWRLPLLARRGPCSLSRIRTRSRIQVIHLDRPGAFRPNVT